MHLKAPAKVLCGRDPKGIYKRYYAGELANVAGLDLPINEPENPDFLFEHSQLKTSTQLATELVSYMGKNISGFILMRKWKFDSFSNLSLHSLVSATPYLCSVSLPRGFILKSSLALFFVNKASTPNSRKIRDQIFLLGKLLGNNFNYLIKLPIRLSEQSIMTLPCSHYLTFFH